VSWFNESAIGSDLLGRSRVGVDYTLLTLTQLGLLVRDEGEGGCEPPLYRQPVVVRMVVRHLMVEDGGEGVVGSGSVDNFYCLNILDTINHLCVE